MNYLELTRKFKRFCYNAYTYSVSDDILTLTFGYEMQSDEEIIPFTHTVSYYAKGDLRIDFDNIALLDNFVFHIGLVETINYWKLACPNEIRINCGYLDENQTKWWKKLFFHGLGEFIYLNKIAEIVSEDGFVSFVSNPPPSNLKIATSLSTPNQLASLSTSGHLIPIGGGKDSVVSLKVLESKKEENLCFVMSPPQAAYDCISVAGYEGYLEAKRSFDAKIMLLNEEGYLNGHVPFSAILAFIATLGAALVGKKFIPLSNEKSANEPSVLGTTFNHQYSKSFEFEQDFHDYCSQYLTRDITYFSLLRPLYEIQIGLLFSNYKEFHPVFRSCNRGKKDNTWCGVCSKCLFVYIILSPFLKNDALVEQFGKDLLDDINLQPLFDELIGIKETKPFECVGTVWEVRHALNMTLKQGNDRRLLKYYKSIKGDMLPDEPTDYENGDLLSDFHKDLLNKEMNRVELLGKN